MGHKDDTNHQAHLLIQNFRARLAQRREMFVKRRTLRGPEHVPKKQLDFFDSNMLSLFEGEPFLDPCGCASEKRSEGKCSQGKTRGTPAGEFCDSASLRL